MSDIQEDRLNEIIDAAFELEGEKREAYLVEACAGDDDLRARVDACLIGADGPVPTSFIRQPVNDVPLSDLEELMFTNSHQFEAGDKVGAYKIVRLLGHGGMGEVYLAQRDDDQYTRQVAIKIVKAGMGTREVLGRFHYERQILANLKHPNIAQLLYGDVTESGLPYFVMEYVEGSPITEYCDTHKLTVRERVQLFKTVCDAVRYAQRNLVVHRDLKPSNILVTAEGDVKLLDFGIAKLLAREGEGQGMHTLTGMRSPFTPSYAGPEQIHGHPVNAATDVYSLGVILYELLTGRRPYELEKGGLTPDNMALICDHIPTIPSHVVTRRFLNEKSEIPSSLSDLRASEPVKLRRLLHGDLDAIVMKALKKEPELRYHSAAELWADVNNYLRKLPISARNDSSRYRTAKFIQRHKLPVAAVAFAVIALLSGLILAISSSNVANQKADLANATVSVLMGMIGDVSPESAKTNQIEPRNFIQAGLSRTEVFDNEPEIRQEMLHVMGQVSLKLGVLDWADSLFAESLNSSIKLFGDNHSTTAQSYFQKGEVARILRDFSGSEVYQRKALAIRRENKDDVQGIIASLNGLASTLYTLSHSGNTEKSSEARKLLNEAISLSEGDEQYSTLLAESYKNMADLIALENKLDSCRYYYGLALNILEKKHGRVSPAVADVKFSLAEVLDDHELYSEAEDLHLEVLDIRSEIYGIDSRIVGDSENELANCYLKIGRNEDAERYYRSTMLKWDKHLPANHLWRTFPRYGLAYLYSETKKPEALNLLYEMKDIMANIAQVDSQFVSRVDKRIALLGGRYDR